MVCKERADEIKLSLEQLYRDGSVLCFQILAEILFPAFSAIHIITSDDVNKYGDKKLSQAMSDHGQHGDRKQRGSSYV